MKTPRTFSVRDYHENHGATRKVETEKEGSFRDAVFRHPAKTAFFGYEAEKFHYNGSQKH